jgi:D-alanine-D-alanine ligase
VRLDDKQVAEMKKSRIRLAIICGGKSTEYEVSVCSARNVYDAVDKSKYDISLVRIEKSGIWTLLRSAAELEAAPGFERFDRSPANVEERPVPEMLQTIESTGLGHAVDAVFPLVHGAFGEDGCLQGFLRLLNLPFVGTGVIGSAVGMDKDVMKRLLNHAGIPTVKFRVVTARNAREIPFSELERELGSPLFVKPANAGSSVGVSKVASAVELARALPEAFRFDEKVLVEEGIRGRELECGVLGNDHPEASVVGEVVVRDEFYSYEAKYVNENGAILEIPALLPAETSMKVRQLAVAAFEVLNCAGMARVDFFLAEDGRVLVNEINTVPGFTNISMFPLLWEASGLSYSDLVDRLVALALERHAALEELDYDVHQTTQVPRLPGEAQGPD